MKRRLILIGALVALLVIPMVVNAAVEKYRYDNTQAWVYWTQIDEPTAEGIVGWHFGYLSVYQYDSQGENGVFAWIDISDAYCPEGVEPWSGHGGHGEEPKDDPCNYDSRFGHSEDAKIEIIGKKLDGARISGQLQIFGGHGGDPVGSPRFSIQLSGVGSTWTSQGMWRDRYQGGMSMYRDRWTNREATVTGNIGRWASPPVSPVAGSAPRPVSRCGSRSSE